MTYNNTVIRTGEYIVHMKLKKPAANIPHYMHIGWQRIKLGHIISIKCQLCKERRCLKSQVKHQEQESRGSAISILEKYNEEISAPEMQEQTVDAFNQSDIQAPQDISNPKLIAEAFTMLKGNYTGKIVEEEPI